MQKFAAGIKAGTAVKQGQVIGYVGSTGLATGPHVCFRFWKNGKQVDHLKESLPNTEPMPASELPVYFIHRDSLMTKLHPESTNGNLTVDQYTEPATSAGNP
jgi:murein DD-endopeptidase MepM/ murein hydrolase activator NlpD